LDFARECRLSAAGALAVAGEVCHAVSRWREFADRNGIARAEQDLFADVIEPQLSALSANAR
jgi:hypothetical protein